MARLGVGSNQYRTRAGAPDVQAPAPDLMAQVAAMSTVERRVTAENPNTPVDILVQLAGDEDEWVRQRVAWNPRTPPQVLAQVVGDEDVDVRQLVAENPNTPADTLVQLVGDEDWHVREAALENPHLPEEYRVLERVAQ